MKLKIPLVKNKKNLQYNFSLPKKKIPKELIKNISKHKYIKIKILE